MRAGLMLVFPFGVGIGTAIPLWGEKAEPLFFATAAEVLALGVVAMALDSRIFRITSGSGRRMGYATVPILIAVGTGLAFAFGALARGDGGAASHFAVTAGALAMGAAGVAIQAIFGIVPEDEAAESGR